MYRELLQQMVCFLDRAHRSLDKMNENVQIQKTSTPKRQAFVPRSLSVHHVSSPPPPVLRAHSTAQIQHDISDSSNFTAFKDFTWYVYRISTPSAPPNYLNNQFIILGENQNDRIQFLQMKYPLKNYQKMRYGCFGPLNPY